MRQKKIQAIFMELIQSCSFLININSRISICPRMCDIVYDCARLNPVNCEIISNKKQQFVLNRAFFVKQIQVNKYLIFEHSSLFSRLPCSWPVHHPILEKNSTKCLLSLFEIVLGHSYLNVNWIDQGRERTRTHWMWSVRRKRMMLLDTSHEFEHVKKFQ